MGFVRFQRRVAEEKWQRHCGNSSPWLFARGFSFMEVLPGALLAVTPAASAWLELQLLDLCRRTTLLAYRRGCDPVPKPRTWFEMRHVLCRYSDNRCRPRVATNPWWPVVHGECSEASHFDASTLSQPIGNCGQKYRNRCVDIGNRQSAILRCNAFDKVRAIHRWMCERVVLSISYSSSRFGGLETNVPPEALARGGAAVTAGRCVVECTTDAIHWDLRL